MRQLLLLLTLIFLAVPSQASHVVTWEEEYIECHTKEVVPGTIVTFCLRFLSANHSYAVVILESSRVLIDFTPEENLSRYTFSTVLKNSDADSSDMIVLRLLRIEGEEWIICDILYLGVVYPGGIPFELTLFSVVITTILIIFLIGYTMIKDYRHLKKKKRIG
jgi:hypothetical protein